MISLLLSSLLLSRRASRCTSRRIGHPDNQQDPIRFRNLLKTMEESLRQNYSNRDVRPLLEPFHALASNNGFWNHTLDGLAVLGTRDMFRVYRLRRPVEVDRTRRRLAH